MFLKVARSSSHEHYSIIEVPTGAAVVFNYRILAVGFNCRHRLRDPSAHAEMVALRNAFRVIKENKIMQCLMFVTTEPCAMCTGILLEARLRHLVYNGGAKNSPPLLLSFLASKKRVFSSFLKA